MTVAGVLSILTMPLSIYFAGCYIGRPVATPAGTIAKIMMTSIVVPLGAGLAVRAAWPAVADRLVKPLGLTARALLLIGAVGLLIAATVPMLALLGNGTLVAMITVVVVGLAAGHWLGGPEDGDRRVLALSMPAATRRSRWRWRRPTFLTSLNWARPSFSTCSFPRSAASCITHGSRATTAPRDRRERRGAAFGNGAVMTAPETRRFSIAIVDDDRLVRVSLVRLCGALELEATAYASALEFLASLENGATRPDCLLLDTQMPEMTGLELQRQLVASGIRIPTIAFTGRRHARSSDALRRPRHHGGPAKAGVRQRAAGRHRARGEHSHIISIPSRAEETLAMNPELTAVPRTDPSRIYRYRDGLYAADLLTAVCTSISSPGWRSIRRRSTALRAFRFRGTPGRRDADSVRGWGWSIKRRRLH